MSRFDIKSCGKVVYIQHGLLLVLDISREFPLDKTREAYETQLNTEEAVKVVIKP